MKKYSVTLGLLVITLLAGAVFTRFSQLDIAVSGLFFDGAGFPLAHAGWAVFLRWAFMVDVSAFVLVMLVLLGMGVMAGARRAVPVRIWLYPLLVFLIGPLLLVNTVFKANWGRARPADIVDFGGAHQFSPALWISDQCSANCSFTSGEGAAIASVAILLAVLFWPMLGKQGRVAGLAFLGAWATLGMGLRIAGGRHFLSDTVFSLLFCALIAALLYKVMGIGQIAGRFTLANLRHDWALMRARLTGTAPAHDDPPPDQAG